MSSIPEKSTMVEKRVSNLLRSSSFQKLKCSATYPFQLAGTKLSKDAVKKLFETLVIKARVLLQKALLVLSIAAFRFYGAVLSFSKYNNLSSGVGAYEKSTVKKTESTLSFSQRILQKIQKTKEHKRKFEKRATEVVTSTSTSTTTVQQANNDKHNNCLLSNNIPKQLNDSTIKFHNEIAALRKYATESISKQQEINQHQQVETILKSRKHINTKQNICFAIFVYISFIFTYLQLLLLTLALNTTIIPPGLIFLISSLFLVTFIVFKIFFMDKTKKEFLKQQQSTATNQHSKTSTTTRTTTQQSTSTALSSLKKSHSCLNLNGRESRSRVRPSPVIDLNNKTLSKIKLL